MIKFSLVANEQQKEGFKFSFQAEGKEEINTCKELSEKLISKITKIEIIVKQYEQEEY